MKILITGGAGFIGSHLADAYLKQGHEVVILDDLSAGSEKNLQGAFKKGARLKVMSLLSDELADFVRSENPDLVNHHAAQKSVRDSVLNPVKDADINLIGLLKLLEACRATSCRKVLFASSGGAIYGEQEFFPATEDHPKRPMSPYGISKLCSEFYLEFYVRHYGFNVGCLRYANIYGPRQDPLGEAGVVAIFCSYLREKKRLNINGTGAQTRDFVFVEDIVSANLRAGDFLNGFQTWNIATGIETSVLKLFSDLKEIAGGGAYDFQPAQPGEQMRSVLSSEVFKNMGWAPKVTLRDGLQKTYDSFA